MIKEIGGCLRTDDVKEALQPQGSQEMPLKGQTERQTVGQIGGWIEAYVQLYIRRVGLYICIVLFMYSTNTHE